MHSGNDADVHAAFGERAPAVVGFKGANQRMARTAEQMDASLIGLWMIFKQSADMCSPKFALFRRERGKVNQVSSIHFDGRFWIMVRSGNAAFERFFFP